MSATSAAIAASDHGSSRMSNNDSNTKISEGEQENLERETSGTMQLLDRLGYGLVSLSASPLAAEESARQKSARRGQQRIDEGPYSPKFGQDSGSFPETSSSFSVQQQENQGVQSLSVEANLVSLSRIRALVTTTTADNGRGVRIDGVLRRSEGDEAHVHSSGGVGRRGSFAPDAATVFKGVRVLLEQNTGDQPGSEQVALECLSVLKDSVSWLCRTRSQEEELEKGVVQSEKHTTSKTTAAMAPQPNAAGNGSHAATACVASTVPVVIDCFSRDRLRAPAEDVLANSIVRVQLPDVRSILVHQLVHHGMEHDEASIRLWSTLAPSRLMARGLMVLEKREYGSLLKGLVGRMRDVDEDVVDAAAGALGQMYSAGPDTFREGEECLDAVHKQILQHYSARIQRQSSSTTSSRDTTADDETESLPGKKRFVAVAESACLPGDTPEPAASAVGKVSTAAAVKSPARTNRACSSFFSPPASEEEGEGANLAESSAATSSSSNSSSTSDDSSSSNSSSSSSSGSDEDEEEDEEEEEEEDDDDDTEEGEERQRPKFERIVDGVTVASWANRDRESPGGASTNGAAKTTGLEPAVIASRSNKKSSTTVGSSGSGRFVPSSSGSINTSINTGEATETPILKNSISVDSLDIEGSGTRSSAKTAEHDDRHHQHERKHPGLLSSPPRPVLAGPAATEMSVILGGEEGVGSCAAVAEPKHGTARTARSGGEDGTGATVVGTGGGRDREKGDRSRIDGGETAATSPPSGPHVSPMNKAGAKIQHLPDGGRSAATGKQSATAERKACVPATVFPPTSTCSLSPPRPGKSMTNLPPETTTAGPSAAAGQHHRNSSASETYTTTTTATANDEGHFTGTVHSSSILGELLRTLVEVEAAGAGRGAKAGGSGSRSPVLKSPTKFEGVGAVDWTESGTSGVRRRNRVRAMESAKTMTSKEAMLPAGRDWGTMQDSESTSSPNPPPPPFSPPTGMMEDVLVVTLRLTDDPDFKIALLALQTMHGFVLAVREHIQPHLDLIIPPLVVKLGDHKIAARHHAMLVLSTVVRVAGLASAIPRLLLARDGLLSAAWRAKEGAVKLVIAGLLCWKPSAPSSVGSGASGVSVGRGVAGERLGHGRGAFLGGNGDEGLTDDGEHENVGRRPGRGEGLSAGRSNGNDSKRKDFHSASRSPAMPPRGAHGCGHRGNGGAALMSTADKEQLVRDLGSLLADERPEVRRAAVEALAVAASVWGANDMDVFRVLERAGLLRSSEPRRLVAARLNDPTSSLPNIGPDGIVNFGAGLTTRLSPAQARRGRLVVVTAELSTNSEQEALARRCGDDGGDAVGNDHHNGGIRGGTSALRCWRSNEAGEREEVAPWKPHQGVSDSDRGGRDKGSSDVGSGGQSQGQGVEVNSGGTRGGNRAGREGAGRRRGHEVQSYRRTRIAGEEEERGGMESDPALSPNNRGGRGGPSGPRRRVSSPVLGTNCGRGDGGKWQGGGGDHTYIPSWADRRGNEQHIPGENASYHAENKPGKIGRGQPSRPKPITSGVHSEDDREAESTRGGGGGTGSGSHAQHGTHERRRDRRGRGPEGGSSGPGASPEWQDQYHNSGHRRRGNPRERTDDSEEETWKGDQWDDSRGVGRTIDVGRRTGGDDGEGGAWRGAERDEYSGADAASSRRPMVVDPDLLSTLKRGGSRNAKASRRAVSAAAGGGGGGEALASGAGRRASGGGPASLSHEGGGGRSRPRPKGGAPAEPTTPVPVGRYDDMGRRSHMETTVQQPLPLSLRKREGGVSGRRGSGGGRGAETFVTGIDVDIEDGGSGSSRHGELSESPLGEPEPEGERRRGFHHQTGVSSATRRRREMREAGERNTKNESNLRACVERDSTGCNDGRQATEDRLAGEGSIPGGDGRGRGKRVGQRRVRLTSPPTPPGGGRATVVPPSPNAALNKPDSFDYLTAEDIRPSPNPSQELQRAMSSLPRDGWPEIFHTLNSVRRLATHHAPLLGSQSHLHALVRDVLGQSENLRSQVAKNALLTLADLWRGLGDTLDPELPMVCPILVKKMADKVEFLAEAARECVDEVVATATESRALSAFLACGSHRSPAVRAKSALAVLLCVRRRCYHAASGGTAPSPLSGAPSSRRAGGRMDKRNGGGGGSGQAGSMGAREMDRLLSALPRFLQDGNQETRHHAKAVVTVIMNTGEVDEARLRREIPPPILERLQREMLNSSLPSGPGFTAPNADAASSTTPYSAGSSFSSSSYLSRSGRNDVGARISRRLGATGPAPSSSGPGVSSPASSFSPTAGRRGGSGGIGDGSRDLRRRRTEGAGGGGGGGGGGRGEERWIAAANGECWRREQEGARGGLGDSDDDDGRGSEFAGGLGTGSLSSPPHRASRSQPRSRNWAGEYPAEGRADAAREEQRQRQQDVAARYHPRQQRGAGGPIDNTPTTTPKRVASISSPGRGGIGERGGSGGRGSSAKRRSSKAKVFHCREAELLPEVYARLDSGDWRERLKGLEEATSLLKEHGDNLHAAGKSARLVDRVADLLSDGNLKASTVNLLALEGVVRLGASMGSKLEPVVNTLVPAVCKNLASSNQQRVALAEEALDALCEAVDPCLFVQPVASLAQYGNARLKVPMLAFLRDITPEVGNVKPILLTKYVRPAALSLVRENHPNVRDAGLSLLRAVEVALDPSSISYSPSRVRRSSSSGQNVERRDRGRGGGSGGGCGSAGASGSRGGNDRWRREDDSVAGRIRDLRQQEEAYPQSVSSATTTSSSDDYHRHLGRNSPRGGFGRTR
ncbi:unnamed protein product [Ectocarpus fasciculatus]